MINKIRKLFTLLINENCLIIFKGIIKRRKYKLLMKKYGFDNWHISPKELRPYCNYIIQYINSKSSNNNCVVEIGCGLGEIIRSIQCSQLYGYDTSKEVIIAAKSLDNKNKVKFHAGTFDQVKGLNIEYLITVNFIHEISPETLEKYYNKLCRENTVNNIIVDTLDNKDYKYNHNFQGILPQDYKLVCESPVYISNRKILVYTKDK